MNYRANLTILLFTSLTISLFFCSCENFQQDESKPIKQQSVAKPPQGFARVNLSEQQRATMKTIRDSSDIDSLSTQFFIENDKLEKLFANSKSTENELLAQVENVNRIQALILATRVKNNMAFRAVLTPEQLAKLDS